MSLISGVEGNEQDVRDKTQALAEKLTPYEIQLSEVGSNGIYYQALFSRVERTRLVLDANIVAQKIFEVDKGKYFPHLSLAYGDLSNEQVTTLQQFVVQGDSITGMHFLAQGIELWRIEGAVEEWCKVAIFPFGKS